MTYNVLLVDDDATDVRVMEHIIRDKMHYKTTSVNNGQEAIDYVTSTKGQDIDLILLDLSMPGIDGMEVLNAIKPVKPNLPIIVRTGHDDLETAIKAMKAGATDFVKKLDDPERLQASISNALRIHVLHDEISRLKRSIGGKTSFEDVIGTSKATKEMLALAEKVATSNIPVLIEGESGVGKELLARAIHAASDRAEKPFIAVNCGAIPENLVESVLFGHEKGAFTGALYKTFGKFREANGGTLFLDEVGELRPDIQVKLLRVLQEGEIEPVGASKPAQVDIRLISATNRDLAEEVRLQHFREDLFYRLNVFPIFVPSLKDRREDITAMIDHFVASFASAENKHITGISEKAQVMLCAYDWPGNIRQLKNVIFRATVLCEKETLDVSDFPQISMPDGHSAQGGAPVEGSYVPILDNNGHIRPLADMEKMVIQTAIDHYHGCMAEVARRLNIGRSTLYRKMEEMGLQSDGA